MTDRTHPSLDAIQAYAQGRLLAEAAAAVEDHLAACTSCAELLERVPGDDNFVLRLREATSAVTGAPRNRDVATGAEATAASMPSSPPSELVNHPRYRVLERIGNGGMGAVYRVEHRRMERVVALKFINPDMTRQPALVERFQQEVRAAARLQHPNIVHAYDADQAGELHFLVMEYIEGQSLAEVVHRRGPLPPNEACNYIRQAANGLQHAHEQDMIHRDIKPQNLMVTSDGVIKILDFGLARLAHTPDAPLPEGGMVRASLTGTGTVMGTADYIAPEQGCDARRVDIRADIYSLGCTLFFLLTGRPPFPGGSVREKLAHHASSDFPALSECCPHAPVGLASVLARMIARDPRDRYPTPTAVAMALTPFCTPTPDRSTRGIRWLWAATSAALLVLAIAGVVIFRNRDTGSGNVPSTSAGDEPPVTAVPKVGSGPAPDLPRALDEAQAVQAIEKLGGRVRRDMLIVGKPVVMVNLQDTPATDDDLKVLASFKLLQQLNLAHTRITDAGLKHLAGLTQLTTLDLPFTVVAGTGLKHVGMLPQLETLGLQNTRVGDEALKNLVSLTQLQRLHLARTRVTDAGMEDVAQLKRLSYLGLEETSVTQAGMKRLTALPLTTLNLFGARGIDDDAMASVGQMRGLRTLDLCGTRVTDAGLKNLAPLQLSSLRLGGLKITDAGVKELARMTALQLLELTRSEITDDGVKEVAGHRRLIDLKLDLAQRVTDEGVKELAGLPELKTLTLRKTHITDASLAELSRCPNLTFLSIMGADQVTDAGVTRLQQARPKLTIQR